MAGSMLRTIRGSNRNDRSGTVVTGMAIDQIRNLLARDLACRSSSRAGRLERSHESSMDY